MPCQHNNSGSFVLLDQQWHMSGLSFRPESQAFKSMQEEVTAMRTCTGNNSGRCSATPVAISCYPTSPRARAPDPLCERVPTCPDDTLCPPWQAPGRLCSTSSTSTGAADINSAFAAGMSGKGGYRKGGQRGTRGRSGHSAAQFDAWHGDLSARLENALHKLTPLSGGPGGKF